MRFYLFLLVFILCISQGFTQKKTAIHVIFESNKEIVLNNGSHFRIIKDTPFYAVMDTSIALKQMIHEQQYRLNRVLLLENKEGGQQLLIEWIDGKQLYYQLKNKPIAQKGNDSISGEGYD